MSCKNNEIRFFFYLKCRFWTKRRKHCLAYLVYYFWPPLQQREERLKGGEEIIWWYCWLYFLLRWDNKAIKPPIAYFMLELYARSVATYMNVYTFNKLTVYWWLHLILLNNSALSSDSIPFTIILVLLPLLSQLLILCFK